jgi:hypothetical protein
MTIQSFYNAAQEREFARKFQFKVVNLGPFDEKDLLYLQTAALPSKVIQNQAVSYFGLDFNVPGSVKYEGSNSWAVNFWCDEGINIRNKMENYVKTIFDDQTSTGLYGVPTEIATMALLGKNLETIRTYQFYGIYPVNTGTLEYDIQSAGEILTMTCTFAYQFWRLV